MTWIIGTGKKNKKREIRDCQADIFTDETCLHQNIPNQAVELDGQTTQRMLSQELDTLQDSICEQKLERLFRTYGLVSSWRLTL